MATRKVPGIGSETVGAGSGVDATFNLLSQPAAEVEGGSCAKLRQGVGDGDRRVLAAIY
jgi:hypothetical protein